jgi:DNA-binding MarR family transcriptional regulator
MATAAKTSASRRNNYTDPVDWARHFWRTQHLGRGEDAFLAMTSVLRFHQIMTDIVHTELKQHKLNITDYMLLMTLQLSDTGTRLISKLARNLLVHATTATLATDRLEARGLLKRTPHPTDRRATLVSITDDGRELVRAASQTLSGVDFGLAGTSKADRRELVEVLARLRAMSGDEGS